MMPGKWNLAVLSEDEALIKKAVRQEYDKIKKN
jgi:hypothetical protein